MLCGIENQNQYEKLLKEGKTFFLYKYNSKGCSISERTYQNIVNRRKSNENNKKIPVYLVDVITKKEISNHISKYTEVRHESPQIFYFKGGTPLAAVSHMRISEQWMDSIMTQD